MVEESGNHVSPRAAVAAKPTRSGPGMGLAVLTLLVIGCGVWWTFFRPQSLERADATGAEAAMKVLPLDSFTVNLADPEDGRFLRVTLALGVDGQLPALAKGESKGPESSAVSMATIRDSILTVLAQCTSGELLTPEGKVKLKQDLLAALNRDVAALGAREVYFTEFLVQR